MTKRWRWLAASGGLLWAAGAAGQSDVVPLSTRTSNLAVVYSLDGSAVSTMSLAGVTWWLPVDSSSNYLAVSGTNLFGCVTNGGAGGAADGIGVTTWLPVDSPTNYLVILGTNMSGSVTNETDPVWTAEKSSYATNGHAQGWGSITDAPNFLTAQPTNAPWITNLVSFMVGAPTTNGTAYTAGALRLFTGYSTEYSDPYDCWQNTGTITWPTSGWFNITCRVRLSTAQTWTFYVYKNSLYWESIPQGSVTVNSTWYGWTWQEYNDLSTNAWTFYVVTGAAGAISSNCATRAIGDPYTAKEIQSWLKGTLLPSVPATGFSP